MKDFFVVYEDKIYKIFTHHLGNSPSEGESCTSAFLCPEILVCRLLRLFFCPFNVLLRRQILAISRFFPKLHNKPIALHKMPL